MMPGFVICGTGGGEANVNGKVETRRKYRWILEISNMPNREWALLKSANRPKLSLGTLEQHHNQEHVWHMGKTKWNDLTMTFYDVEQQPDVSAGIFTWLQDANYNINAANPDHPSNYKKDATLRMLSHSGATTENWKLCHAWPYDVDWGGLDYSAEELCEIVVIMKYDRAQKQ
jgi:hypothetical protein